MNYTQAYLNAGYKCTEETARRRGSSLMTNNDILQRFMELAKESSRGSVMSLQEAKERLSSIGRQEPQKGMDQDGREISVIPTVAEARGAIESIIKMNGGFIDRQKLEMTGDISIVDVMRQAEEREERLRNDT
jgi:hypothetical protein